MTDDLVGRLRAFAHGEGAQLGTFIEAAARIEALEAENGKLRHKLWMVACHATGGGIPEIEGIDRPVNDICVQITARVNVIYEAGKDAARAALTPEAPHAD